ncbi:Yip1 domain-containing protein [Cryptosporidium muris RN66]|uniref:Yip1 domain-containing protein n=1 Tax=Cryptosporidium muris (strain RN66) TaxID=441375 RepID=B6AEK4_CRYMR|nr:Yip1 domain-containing protein [Cryptosporidium muris RN66]EEA06621.1 Yip1 domain-containing protein [Cryptosporidium muris RN66]|eukprot:XP_002140970.1 Yip1 domain-containing protein [Cryptosporidium muris RN66]
MAEINSLQFYTANKMKAEEEELNRGYNVNISRLGNIPTSQTHESYQYPNQPNHYNQNQYNQQYRHLSHSTYFSSQPLAQNQGIRDISNTVSQQATHSNYPITSPFNISKLVNNPGTTPSSNLQTPTTITMDSTVPVIPSGQMSSFNSYTKQTTSYNISSGSSSSIISTLSSFMKPSFWSSNGINSDEQNNSGFENDDLYIDDEPPLLEELGINPTNIWNYIKCVILFQNNMNGMEWDMAGPILLIGCLGFCLLLAGKIHFGYIYGIGILSCLGTYILLNIMSNKQSIDLYTTMSILGYSLLPIVLLAGISVIYSLRSKIGISIAIFFNMWSTITASRFFELTVSLKHQRFLIAYPIALLYACFTIVTIF